MFDSQFCRFCQFCQFCQFLVNLTPLSYPKTLNLFIWDSFECIFWILNQCDKLLGTLLEKFEFRILDFEFEYWDNVSNIFEFEYRDNIRTYSNSYSRPNNEFFRITSSRIRIMSELTVYCNHKTEMSVFVIGFFIWRDDNVKVIILLYSTTTHL